MDSPKLDYEIPPPRSPRESWDAQDIILLVLVMMLILGCIGFMLTLYLAISKL
jgi:hypothetical protein